MEGSVAFPRQVVETVLFRKINQARMNNFSSTLQDTIVNGIGLKLFRDDLSPLILISTTFPILQSLGTRPASSDCKSISFK